MVETKYAVLIVGAEPEEETLIRQKIGDLVNVLRLSGIRETLKKE